jgi:hypothetical protein
MVMYLKESGATRRFVLIVGALLAAKGAAAAPDDLRLYGVVLETATVTDFLQAANKAGVRTPARTRDSSAVLEFDATGAGVPGLRRFRLLRDAESIVSVQFDLDKNLDVDEALRKMLEAKYGPPIRATGGMFIPGQFSERYFSGRAQWSFARDMALVYQRAFMGDSFLTYVHQARFEQLMAAAKARAASSAQNKAKQFGEKF